MFKLMRKRLEYNGGVRQEDRMIKDKLRSLKKALLYSYQAATIALQDERQFRCLINRDKNKPDYDNKIISIPYKDICLNKDRIGTTTEGMEEIGMKCGDVFHWIATDTYWLVYLEILDEDAYFRAEIRRADNEVKIYDTTYKIYLRGEVETTIPWLQKNKIETNTMNYSLIMYITQNEETLEYLHRFKQVKIDGDTWVVKAINNKYGDGIIKVVLGEDNNNTVKDLREEEEKKEPKPPKSLFIEGNLEVYPYTINEYKLVNVVPDGKWVIEGNDKVKITDSTDDSVNLLINTGRSGSFDLIYRKDSMDDIVQHITIVSI